MMALALLFVAALGFTHLPDGLTATTVRYLPLVVTGAGSGSSNYTLLAGRTMFLGSSNVNIVAVMGTDVALVDYATATITNLSADVWGVGFSSITNRWRWSGVYGTNAPTVLTNGTALELSIKSDGTNTVCGYTYFSPAR